MQNQSEFLNENAFGTPDKPGNYHVPMDEKTGELGEVKFNDGVAKSLDLVLVQKTLTHFLNEASKLTDWKECVTLLIDIFKGLRKREDFTDADILLVKQQIILFTPKWLKLTGR
jgi:hypothetical protein